MIRFENVFVRFKRAEKEFTAVDNFSLEIKQGEFFGIVGASGAGKSTLVRTVNLLQRPTSGKVYVNNEDITDYTGAELKKLRLNIGMIFQHFNLIKNATVYSNVAFALKASGTPPGEIDRNVSHLLEVVGLKSKAQLYPNSLSGGQKQRVAIARALANKPQILLCDEATSALDPDNTAEVVKTLKEIKKSYPITILFITHQMEVAKTLFDRVAVMDHGKLAEVQDAYSLFSNPQSLAARNLIRNSFDKVVPQEVLSHENNLYLMTFKEEKAYDPVIAQVSKHFSNTSLSILAGNIEYIQNKPLGRLLISLRGDDERERQEVLSYLSANAYLQDLSEAA